MVIVSEKELQEANNLIRMGSHSRGYLQGYDDGVNDVLKSLWREGYKEMVEGMIKAIENHNKTHQPINVNKPYVRGEEGQEDLNSTWKGYEERNTRG